MAGSRLEKIGTIYTRTSGLIQSGALKWEDRPVWYDVYEAFPPLDEPKFDRPAPKIPLRKIFYEEDKIRAMLHQNVKHFNTNFFAKSKSLTQKFIDVYREVNEQAAGSCSEEEVFKQALEMFKRKADAQREDENVSLSREFSDAQGKSSAVPTNVDLKDIFKE